MIFPFLFSLVRIAISFLLYLAIGSDLNLEYVFSSSSISRTFFSFCVLSITTVARPLSAGRMMIVSFLPSDFNAFLFSLLMLDLGGFADFKVPFMSAHKLSTSVCGSVKQACSVATIYCSIGICFGAIA